MRLCLKEGGWPTEPKSLDRENAKGWKREMEDLCNCISVCSCWGGRPTCEAEFVSFKMQMPCSRMSIHFGMGNICGFSYSCHLSKSLDNLD